MFASYFTAPQQATIAAAALLGLGAVVAQGKGRTSLALGLLVFSALVLRLFAATLDPYLNYWDEVYHAAVAKNMVHHPFTPMLYTEAAMPITENWTRMHVWLHKPPFFLWQMALSIQLFGAEPWAVRLPSALWTTAMVPVTYRIALLLTDDRRSAFAAALLTVFSYLLEELTSGGMGTDHNDAIFLATVACSYWTFLEWLRSDRWTWALLTGLFAACAVLTKWYLGAFIFLPWGCVLLRRRLAWKPLLQAAGGFGAMAAPVYGWTLSTSIRFPAESAYQWRFKALHFSNAIDGHEGTWAYHFEAIQKLLPPLAWWWLLPALIWLVWSVRHAERRLFLVMTVLPVHLFFLLAANKMLCYTFVLLPLYLTAVGHGLVSLVDRIVRRRANAWVLGGACALMAGAMLDIEDIQLKHTVYTVPAGDQIHRMQQLAVPAAEAQLLQQLHGPEHEVLFGLPRGYDVQFMFRYGYQSMDIIPSEEDVQRLKAKGYSVAILQDGRPLESLPPGARVIPDSVVTYPRIARL